MGFHPQITRSRTILAAGLLAVVTWESTRAGAPSSREVAADQADATSTLSAAPQLAARVAAVSAQTTERLLAAVLGASPTRLEPVTSQGIASLGGGRAAATASRRTAWMDYMIAPAAPGWSLRLATKSAFEMTATDRLVDAAPSMLVSEAAQSSGGFGKFGFSVAAPANSGNALAPGGWTTMSDAGVRSGLLPSPITSLRDSTPAPSDASLLTVPLAAPPSAAGAAAGAAPVPQPHGQ